MKLIITGFLFATLYGCSPGSKTSPGATPLDEKNFVYRDGSANRYNISSTSFEYIPVRPEESSSGSYSGGDPVKNKPVRAKFQQFADLVLLAYEAKTDHTEMLAKGNARIEMNDGAKSTSFILKMGSSWIKQIEVLLADMKDD